MLLLYRSRGPLGEEWLIGSCLPSDITIYGVIMIVVYVCAACVNRTMNQKEINEKLCKNDMPQI